MQTSSKDIVRLNKYQLQWLPPGDPVETATVLSYGNVRTRGDGKNRISHEHEKRFSRVSHHFQQR